MIPYLFKLFEVPRQTVALDITADPVVLDIGQAIPCALVLNELLSNAFKHAFRSGDAHTGFRENSRVALVIREFQETVYFEVSDNGSGIPEAFDIFHSSTMGLKMVRTLVMDQLKGCMEVIPAPGTRFIMSFHKNAESGLPGKINV